MKTDTFTIAWIKPILIAFFVTSILVFFAGSAAMADEPEEKGPLTVNVFALVSQNIEGSFKNAAELLKKEEGVDSFPNRGFQVHCTLYMTQYEKSTLDTIISRTEALALRKKPFETRTTGLELTSGNWFFMNMHPGQDLQALSDAVVKLMSPLRFKTDYIPQWVYDYPEKLEYIQKYGSPNVFGQFNPHLTFLSGGDKSKIARFMTRHSKKDFAGSINGQIVGIGVGIADKDGQIAKPVRVFMFK